MITPCTIDADGRCERHNRRHVGKLRELALDPGDRGQAARRTWDKAAGIPVAAPPTKPAKAAAKSRGACRHFGPRVRDVAGNVVQVPCEHGCKAGKLVDSITCTSETYGPTTTLAKCHQCPGFEKKE